MVSNPHEKDIQMKLYTYPKSRSLRAVWALEEIGVPYETVKVDLLSPAPAVKSPHPFGKVPFLVDGPCSVGETLAICLYICEQHPSALYPQDAAERATVNAWISFALTDLESGVWGLLKQLVFTPENQRSADVINYFRGEASSAVARVSLPAGQDWITGKQFTLADIFLSHVLMWAKLCGIPLSDELESYIARAASRPAFLQAQERNNG